MIDPATGVLLIADPFLKDPNFLRTVVVLCEQNDDGAVGFVINRLFEHTLNELLPEAEDLPLPVYYGGPVQPNSIHFVHQYPALIPGGQEIVDGICWGGDFELALSLLRKKEISEDKIRIFIGYSGWDTGQLQEEIKEKSWLTVQATPRLLFQSNAANTWKDALKELGGEYEMMIHYPIDPQLN
ncbi:MAG TPA: YqgE/AlgH family protein [Chitinophagaceae bacterium]|nr:YqgE/AlgH family protein [Chitinophagaceae bacterium]